MEDKITLERIKDIHPSLRKELESIYNEICSTFPKEVTVRFTQVYRSFELQNNLYAQGRTRPGKIITNAKGGQSYHNYGFAVDFCIIYNDKEVSWSRTKDYDRDLVPDWIEVVKIFQSYGWKWGASFNDYPHFEKPPMNWRNLLKLYNKKEFIAGERLRYVKL